MRPPVRALVLALSAGAAACSSRSESEELAAAPPRLTVRQAARLILEAQRPGDRLVSIEELSVEPGRFAGERVLIVGYATPLDGTVSVLHGCFGGCGGVAVDLGGAEEAGRNARQAGWEFLGRLVVVRGTFVEGPVAGPHPVVLGAGYRYPYSIRADSMADLGEGPMGRWPLGRLLGEAAGGEDAAVRPSRRDVEGEAVATREWIAAWLRRGLLNAAFSYAALETLPVRRRRLAGRAVATLGRVGWTHFDGRQDLLVLFDGFPSSMSFAVDAAKLPRERKLELLRSEPGSVFAVQGTLMDSGFQRFHTPHLAASEIEPLGTLHDIRPMWEMIAPPE